MKTIRFQLLLLALFVMVGCQKDEMSTSMKKGSYSLVASIENNDSTSRTAVDENGGVTWVATDAIGVFGTQTKNAKFESIGAGANVTFVGDLESSHEEPTLAYYPYDENASLDGNALSFTLPSEYSYTGQSYAPMLGIKQVNGDFSFKHLVGLLKVTVKNMPENAKRLFVVSEGTEEKAAPAITGDVLVNDVTANNATLSITENKGHEVSIDLKNTSAQETYIFYIPVPAGEYPKLSVKLEMNDGVIYMDKSVSNVSMTRALMLDMPLIDLLEKKPDLGENMVLSDNTVLLTEDFSRYVLNPISDDGIIILDMAFPEEQLPVVGDILFYGDASESFPNGLLNRILQIEKSEKGYKLITEPAAFEDAFDKLYINQESILELKDDNISRGGLTDILPNFPFPNEKLPYWDDEGFVGYQYIFGFKIGKGFDLNTNNEKFNWSFNGNGEFSFDRTNYFAMKLRSHIEIDKELDKSFISLLYDFKIGGNYDILGNANLNGGLEMQLAKWNLNPVPLTPQGAAAKLLVDPEIGLNIFLNVGAEMELEWEDTFEKRYQVAYLYDKGKPVEWNIKEIRGTGDKEALNCLSLNLKGSIIAGISAALGFKFVCGSLNAELPVSFGVKSEAESFPKKDENGNYSYELLKNEKIERSVEITAELAIKSPFLKSEEKENKDDNKGKVTTLPLLNMSFPWDTLYYVPEFNILNSYDHGDKCSVLYGIDRSLIWPVDLNIALKNDENTILTESDNKLTYWSWLITGENTIDAEFTGIDPTEIYSICPIINLPIYGKIYAEPVVERKGIKVYTEKYEKDYSTGSILCYGRFENVDDKSYFFNEYGICYNLQSEPTEKYLVPSENLIDDLTFFASLNHLKSGIYEYRAYFKIGDKYYYADETNSFEVKSESVVTTDATNITQTAATLSGKILNYETNNFQYGIIYSTDANPTASNGKIAYSNNIQGDGSYSVDVASLSENTTYYYRAFVRNNGDYVYADDVLSFKTLKPVEDNEGMTEREILIAFYNATDGDNWANNENWCSDKPLGEWHGITTDGDGYVTSIYLSGELVIETKESRKFGLKGNANLSNLSKLEGVFLNHNQLSSLNVNNCKSLTSISCDYNELKNSDVSMNGCSNLEGVSLEHNQLKYLDFSSFENLLYINCRYNVLENINVRNNIQLQSLTVNNNNLTSLDVSGCSNLSTLSVSENQLTSLDVSNSKVLNILFCDRNQLTSLNVTGCNELQTIDCYGNQITAIDLKGKTQLTRLICDNNKLSSIDVTGLSQIKSFSCTNNELTKLDISDLVKIREFSCKGNKLTSLDVSKCTGMVGALDCSDNLLTEIKIPDCLSYLTCSNNNFVELDLSGYTNLKQITCLGEVLKVFKAVGCTSLSYVRLENKADVDVFNLTGCTNLISVWVGETQIKEVYLPASMSKFKGNFDEWGDWIESENRYQYPKFHWQ